MAVFQIAIGSTLPITTYVVVGGSPDNLASSRVVFTLKMNPTDPDSAALAILDNQALGGVTIANPASGQVQIVVPASATYGLPNVPRTLFYEVWVKDIAGNEFRTEKGRIVVDPRALTQQP